MSEYSAIKFGDISSYMRNKQAKLVNQNNSSFNKKSDLFNGLALHINGYTNPSFNQLRQLIIENGGVFLHYLNNKSDVTHIISNNLTPRKVIEFKHIKCCTPDWLLQSIQIGRLLPWQNFILNTSQTQPSLFNYNSPNKQAENLLQSDQWRRDNTAQSDQFLDSYYNNSRLHFLSSTKATLKDLVQSAQQNVTKEHLTDIVPSRTYILHVDMDSFFVSASLSLPKHAHLVNSPVAISHSTSQSSSSTSELASVNYKAREFGIRNGMLKTVAYQLCPQLVTLPYDFQLYNQITVKLYEIFLQHCDHLEAVSVDEALLDVSKIVHKMGMANGHADNAYELSKTIRHLIHSNTKCDASVGIGSNILLAKLATRHAKPNGIYHLHDHQAAEFLAPHQFDILPGVGSETKRKLITQLNVSTIGELVSSKSMKDVQHVLGKKNGETLWKYCNGIDERLLSYDKKRQSVSAEYGIRFENVNETQKFFANLSTEVSRRLKAAKCKGGHLTLKLMVRRKDAPKEAAKFLGHGVVDIFNKSAPLSAIGGGATDDDGRINECAWRLFTGLGKDARELRGVGLQVNKLDHYGGGGGDDGEGAPAKRRERDTESIQDFFKKPAKRTKQGEQQATSSRDSVSGASTSRQGVAQIPPQAARAASSSADVVDISSDKSMDTSTTNKAVTKQPFKRPQPQPQPQPQPRPSIKIDDSIDTSVDTSADSITSTTSMPTQADRSVWKAIPRSIRREVLDERTRVKNALRTPFKVPMKVDKKSAEKKSAEKASKEKVARDGKQRARRSNDAAAYTPSHLLDSSLEPAIPVTITPPKRPRLRPVPVTPMQPPTPMQSMQPPLLPPPTPSLGLLPTQADPSVWRALPSDIRKEVLSEREASKSKGLPHQDEAQAETEAQLSPPLSTPPQLNLNHPAISAPATPLATPSINLKPSQADADVWKALPSTIRREILGERMSERMRGGPAQASTSAAAANETETSNANTPAHPAMPTSALPSPSQAIPNSQIDRTVWRELPSSVRRNLFEEMSREKKEREREELKRQEVGRAKEKEKEKEQAQAKERNGANAGAGAGARTNANAIAPRYLPPITHKSQLRAQRSKVAVLMRKSEIGDILAVMEQWLDVYIEHGPHASDINRVKMYLHKSLTEDSEGMGKTRTLLRLWKRKLAENFEDGFDSQNSQISRVDVAGKWHQAFEDVKNSVDDIVIHRWGCRLSLR
ncbi:hypothetical protein E3P99_01262 [Wallemia hederae]|uniref:DNA repair protein REV1 n=1 Tax=Wallemia hederae TaxID=1540922 RepID=A0A4T0FRE5_9BASI|nr:hypothetical protein E3P99_01262 [Wallemia hederae]